MPSNDKAQKNKPGFFPQSILFLIMGISAVLWQGGCRKIPGEASMNKETKIIEEQTEFLDAVNSVDPALFTAVDQFEDIPSVVYFESAHWDKMIFRESKGPHSKDTKSRHYFYLPKNEAEFDLLRHEYPLADISITVTESRIFLHILIQNFSPHNYGGGDPLAQAAALGVALLNISDKPQFQWVNDKSKYNLFTSNPNTAYVNINKWFERIDGTVTTGGIVLLCYKKDPAWDSFVDPTDWFPPQFRNK